LNKAKEKEREEKKRVKLAAEKITNNVFKCFAVIALIKACFVLPVGERNEKV